MAEGPGRAIDAPGVAAALSRERRKAWTVLLCGVLLFGGFTAGATAEAERSEALERDAVRVEGRVLGYSAGGRLISGHVDIEFEVDDASRTERVQLDDSSPRYEEGQSVVVLIDPEDDDRVTVEGEDNQPQWSVWLMITAFILGGIGVVAGPWVLLRTRRQRRLLSREPWRLVGIRYREVASGNSVRGLLRIADGDSDRVLALVSTARWNLARTGLRGAEEVCAVGDASTYLVLRSSDTARLVSAKAPRTSRAERRWRSYFDEPR